MITTTKLLAAFKKAHGNCSDYRAAQLLNISKGTVSKWVRLQGHMSEETARKAAKMLGWPEEYTVACIHAEQKKGTENYDVWKVICKNLEPRNRAA